MRNINTSLTVKWFTDVWNNGQRESIDNLLDKDAIIHGLDADKPLTGIDQFKKSYDDFRTQLKDIHLQVDDVIAQDDMEACRVTVNATHIATGKKVKFSGQCMTRIKDGKIVEGWNNFDFLNMNNQLA